MQLGRLIIVAVFFLILTACASSRLTRQMEVGKQAFQANAYPEAFHQLLPVAVQGKSEAQYAVGYMYYYGYGVAADNESGLFWMTRAAEQHDPLAEQALKLIQQHNTTEAAKVKPSEEHDPRDEVMQALHQPVVVNKLPKKVAQQEKQVMTSAPILTPRYFTLQLYGSYHLAAVKKVQAQLRLKNTGHIYQMNHEGKDWYILTFGHFLNRSEAAATKNNLPTALQALQPWVRNMPEVTQPV